jgi:hypothetical protein
MSNSRRTVSLSAAVSSTHSPSFSTSAARKGRDLPCATGAAGAADTAPFAAASGARGGSFSAASAAPEAASQASTAGQFSRSMSARGAVLEAPSASRRVSIALPALQKCVYDVSPSAHTLNGRPASDPGASEASQSQKARASGGGTPSPCVEQTTSSACGADGEEDADSGRPCSCDAMSAAVARSACLARSSAAALCAISFAKPYSVPYSTSTSTAGTPGSKSGPKTGQRMSGCASCLCGTDT